MKRVCVVIPVVGDDEELCLGSLRLIKAFGKAKQFPSLLVTTLDNPVKDKATLLAIAGECFLSVSTLELPNSFGNRRPRWPEPHNLMFLRVAQHFAWDKSDQYDAFYYKEPDVWPLCSGWMTRMAEEYSQCGQKFMGPIVSTPNASGKMFNTHMNGAAIYPVNALTLAPEITLAKETPWDILASQRILGECYDASKTSMACAYRTSNFIKEGDVFTTTQKQVRIVDKQTVESEVSLSLDLRGFCVFHGCKDLSLAQSFLSEPEQSQVKPVDAENEVVYIPETVEQPDRCLEPTPICSPNPVCPVTVNAGWEPTVTVPKKRHARRKAIATD